MAIREAESNEHAKLRQDVRAWLQENKPPEPTFMEPENFMFVETDQQFEYLLQWQRKLYEAGYLGLEWPSEYGGGGGSPGLQNVVAQELSRAGTPAMLNVIGLQWAGPVILDLGTEEQKQRLLKPMLTGEEIWCQGFSEPGSGSDLASASTKAGGNVLLIVIRWFDRRRKRRLASNCKCQTIPAPTILPLPLPGTNHDE